MAEDNDVTEQAEARKNPDITVVNNGTLQDLNAVVDTLYNDLLSGTTKSNYAAV